MDRTILARAAGLALLPLGLAAAMTLPATAEPATANVVKLCADAGPGQSACQALMRTDLASSADAQPTAAPSGYGPADIQAAYKLPSAGDGVTVAIVDAFD